MKTLAQLADEIWAWQQATFGDAMTVQGAVNKLRDEAIEAAEARNRAALIAELADCFFMLTQATNLEFPAGFFRDVVADEIAGRYPRDLCVRRMMLELGRCVEAMHRQRPVDACVHWRLACAYGVVLDDMPAAIEAKLAKNKARTWAKPAADGTISHVKEVG